MVEQHKEYKKYRKLYYSVLPTREEPKGFCYWIDKVDIPEHQKELKKKQPKKEKVKTIRSVGGIEIPKDDNLFT